MAGEPDFLSSVTSRYATARDVFTRISAFLNKATFKIKRAPPLETIDEIAKRFKTDDYDRLKLKELAETKTGVAFIEEKTQDINRASFHRSAFALNAFTHLFFVDLAAQLSFSFLPLKFALAIANVILALLAHSSERQSYRALIAGPNALPPKRRFWGMFPNPAYNRAVKKNSRSYAQSAWEEKSLFRPAYFANAAVIFLGAQFILPPDRLIFPASFIVGKISGLFTTLVIAFDVWRGVRAGDAARIAREKEVSVYRHLDI
ncbi:MAG: hypothetical protein AB7F41_02400 [Methylocystis sp.]|uniref:hypothetical protein n=1 Tax=Methylocystis sp. TaxID=1911079 RepID=UPI003D0CEADF